ncbi:hypothetical protein CR513_32075, partial [Mucuna pruriens]
MELYHTGIKTKRTIRVQGNVTKHIPFLLETIGHKQHLQLSIILSFLLIFRSFSPNLLIILLKSSKIFTGLGEFPFFHTLTNIPMHKGPLGIHKIKLVVNAREHLSNRSVVAYHANSPLHLGKVTPRNYRRRLFSTDLETCIERIIVSVSKYDKRIKENIPINKLNSPFGFDGSNSSIDILRNNIATVHQAASHVLAMSGITFGHHASRLKDGIGDLRHGQLLMVGLGG